MGFQTWVIDVRVQTLFSKLGLEVDAMTTETLFDVLDLDGDGIVSAREYVTALTQVHGNAKRLDVAKLKYDLQKLAKDIEKLRFHRSVGPSFPHGRDNYDEYKPTTSQFII